VIQGVEVFFDHGAATVASSPLKKRFRVDYECHWLRQCREIVMFSALAEPVAHFFDGLLESMVCAVVYSPIGTALVSSRKDRRIALFLSGRRHAGENLREVLSQ
jgi:hypothetical protein